MIKLNKENKEILIDYLFSKDKNEYLVNKFSGFEGIIFDLVRKEKVKIAKTSNGEIEKFFEQFKFIKLEDSDLRDFVVCFSLNVVDLIHDEGFKPYRNLAIKSMINEIKQIENEKNEVENELDRLVRMFETDEI
jgi:hypothetical protein